MVCIGERAAKRERLSYQGGNDLETAAEQGGISADWVRDAVALMLSVGCTLEDAAKYTAWKIDGGAAGIYEPIPATLKRARQLVRLAYVGS
jgi:hypothetical protein